MSAEQLEALATYSACDISDALLKLEVPGAGFLPDIVSIPAALGPLALSAPPKPALPAKNPTSTDPATAAALSSEPVWSDKTSEAPSHKSPAESPNQPLSSDPTKKVIAPASTVLFVPKSSGSFPEAAPPLSLFTQTLSAPTPNIPSDVPYSDLTTPSTIVVLSQPREQVCAVAGGIMAVRMARLGAKGIVVDGRVRDLDTMRQVGIPVYSRGTSTIGTAGEAKAWAHNVPVSVGETVVEPGDVVMIDPTCDAVVSIPAGAVAKVLEMLPAMVEADVKVMAEVEMGGEVGAAFAKYRGK